MTKITYIPGEIANAAIDEHGNRKPVTRTQHIFDDAKGKKQSEINADVDDKFTQVDNEIEALEKQDVIPVDTLPAIATADPKKIYRVVGEDSYTDYMVNASGDGWKTLATYSFPGIDDKPTVGSEKLVKSGGVYNADRELAKSNSFYLQDTFIDTTTGEYCDRTGFASTQKISVAEDDAITTEYNMFRVAEYNGSVFKGLAIYEGKSYTVPSAVTHISIIFYIANAFGNIFLNGKSINGVFVKKTLDELNSEYANVSKENPIYYFGKGINSSDGTYNINPNLFTTLDIPVSQDDVVTCDRSMYRVAEYNDGSFIRLAVNESSSYTVPSNVDTIRIVFNAGEPKGLYLNDIRVNAIIISNLKSEVPPELTEHVNNHNNPHQVTKEQLGIANATTTVAGLLSPIDKAKIDSLQYSINITGSGITKNASAYGFLPSASADDNNTALQNAVNGGGTILIDVPGVYDLSGNIVIPSNTTIIFGKNTFVRKCANESNVVAKYIFVNEGAQYRTYNEKISIIGLTLYTNGKAGNGGIVIYGLRGHIALFYVKNVLLKDITILDSTQLYDFNIHICTFEDVHIEGARIDSYKDGLHFGNGKNLYINDCVLATADDPIALNAYDYVSGNPELGWIENIHISNIVLVERTDKNGRPIQIIGGGWSDWASGNEYQSQGDTVVYDGKIFRTAGSPDATIYTSSVPPASVSLGVPVTGTDGITWVLTQNEEVYKCGVKNLYVDGFAVKHGGAVLFNVCYEADPNYCRSYYPGSVNYGIHENLYFKGVVQDFSVTRILSVTAPVRNIVIEDSVLNAAYLGYYQNYQGKTIPSAFTEASWLVLQNNTFVKTLSSMRLDTYNDIAIKYKSNGNIPLNDNFVLSKMSGVTVVTTDV